MNGNILFQQNLTLANIYKMQIYNEKCADLQKDEGSSKSLPVISADC